MSNADREKWNARYCDESAAPDNPSVLLTQLADVLPHHGKALDVAGGAGRHAIWLACSGLDVTLADISANALAIARRRGEKAGVRLHTCCVDLQLEPFPAGPWDLIVSFHYLQRSLFQQAFSMNLAPGGLLVLVQPTRKNLSRHEKPPEDFLLEDGELPTLVGNLEIVRYEEGWLAEGRHDAYLVARRC